MASYRMCPSCNRHVKTSERACPFCDATLPAGLDRTEPLRGGGGAKSRAALLFLSATAAMGGEACGKEPRTDAPDAAPTTTNTAVQAVPAYGAPPPFLVEAAAPVQPQGAPVPQRDGGRDLGFGGQTPSPKRDGGPNFGF
jgi:hypothetical protein